MRSAKSVGRILGVLVFLHLATGLMAPYIMLQPVSTAPASALAVAAGLETQIRLPVALLFVGGVIPLAIAITAWPVLRPRSPALGQWLLALAVVTLAMQIVENQHYLSLLSMSLEHGRASGAGIVTTMMQLVGITLPVLLGYRIPLSPEVWGMPLGVAYLGLSLWLMARGVAAEPARGVARDT